MSIVSKEHCSKNMVSALEILSGTTEFEFVLVGSRRFGFVSPMSDFDFYTRDSASVREWLKAHGFVSVLCAGYTDSDCVCVFRLQNVDVQLRKRPEIYEKACERVDNAGSGFYSALQTSEPEKRKKIWNALMELERNPVEVVLMNAL